MIYFNKGDHYIVEWSGNDKCHHFLTKNWNFIYTNMQAYQNFRLAVDLVLTWQPLLYRENEEK